MRTKVPWAVVLVFSVFVVGAAAQPRVIPESEFSTVVSKGYDMLSTLPYRAQISDKTPIYGQQVSTEVLVLEVVEHQPPRRYRNVKIWKSENGRRREEFVTIDGRTFRRTNEGPWSEDPVVKNRYTVKDDALKVQETNSFRDLGSTELEGEKVHIFESIIKREYQPGASPFVSHEYLTRYWVAKDGRFVRAETKTTGRQAVTFHSVTEYEYDPNIKIEAPIK